MNRISRYIGRFFRKVESTPIPTPTESELVDGKAFTIKHYPLAYPLNVHPLDTITATITEHGLTNDGIPIATVTEEINMSMTVDTISTIRFNDALGFKHAVGALFGQRKK